MDILTKEVRDATEQRFAEALVDEVEIIHFHPRTQAVCSSNVIGVPRTIINESTIVERAVQEETFLEHVLKAAKSEDTE